MGTNIIELTTEDYFTIVRDHKERILAYQSEFQELLDRLIRDQDARGFAGLKQVFDEDGQEVLTTLSGDMVRIRAICSLVGVELANGAETFLYGADNWRQLLAKWMRLVFLLRRIEMDFPEELQRETMVYILQNRISVYAPVYLLGREVFADRAKVYAGLYQWYQRYGMGEEGILLLLMAREEYPEDGGIEELLRQVGR